MNLFVIHVIFKPSFISYPADVVSVFSLELKRPVREAVHSILAIAETENILKCVMCVCVCFVSMLKCIVLIHLNSCTGRKHYSIEQLLIL